MPINADISGIPSAQRAVSKLPSLKPIVVNVVGEAWYRAYLDADKDTYAPAIPELPYRASLAGNRCDRQLFWNMTGVEPSNPNTMADAWRFELGHYVGDGLARHMLALGDGWFPEWTVDLRPIGIEGSAHVDMTHMQCPSCGVGTWMQLYGGDVLRIADEFEGHPKFDHWADIPYGKDPLFMERTTHAVDALGNELLECQACGLDGGGEYLAYEMVECKSINGFGFKMAATDFKGPAEGPKSGHLLQVAMPAKALGCDRIILAYFSLENLSPGLAERYAPDDRDLGRFTAEWHYNLSGFEKPIEHERARIARILKYVGTDRVPVPMIDDAPEFPEGAVVVSPSEGTKSRWHVEIDGQLRDSGTYWGCGYCAHRTHCQEYGIPEDSPVDAAF